MNRQPGVAPGDRPEDELVKKRGSISRTIHAPLTVLALLILLGLSATNIYRARTQSITCDEANSYEMWGAKPLSRMLVSYDASNHVLQTILSKISIATFGLSEFALRLPTVLGGFLYFIAVYRLCSLVLGRGGLFLLGVCVLSLNPFLLDLLSAARGYGLALAFCMWAVFYMVRDIPLLYSPPATDASWEMARLAVLLVLSVSSNITFLFVDVGLALLFIGAALTARTNRREVVRVALTLLTAFVIPGIALSLFLLAPLAHAKLNNFYFGWPSLAKSTQSLVYVSLIHHLTLGGIHYYYDGLSRLVDFISGWFAPAVVLVALFVWFRMVALGFETRTFLKESRDRFIFVCAGALILSLVESYIAHGVTGLLYPIRRTGLPWVVFFLLTCLGLAKKFQDGPAALQSIRWTLQAFLVACTLWFAFEFNTSVYSEWAYDAGSKRIVAILEKQHQAEPAKDWPVAVTWTLLPSMNFYKMLYHLNWFDPVDNRKDTNGASRFILTPAEAHLAEAMKLRALYTDPVSGQVLAIRPDRN